MGIGTKEHHKIGSIGKAVPSVQAKVVDKNSDCIGELLVKGPSIMLGYFENEKATKEVTEGGWFKTGDLARIDEEGYIFICGRKKSVIVLKMGRTSFQKK